MSHPQPLQHLIKCLSGLPGIGEKTATRLAFFIMNQPREDALELGRSILEVRETVHLCSACFNFTETERCSVCTDVNRDQQILCVVESPADLMAIEKTGHYRGVYHVLHGTIAPLDGIGPDQLKLRELLQRLEHGQLNEVIIATNPTLNGNATALYIAQQLKARGVKITRIAQGIPTGGDIEYTDQVTLTNALEGRREMK